MCKHVDDRIDTCHVLDPRGDTREDLRLMIETARSVARMYSVVIKLSHERDNFRLFSSLLLLYVIFVNSILFLDIFSTHTTCVNYFRDSV